MAIVNIVTIFINNSKLIKLLNHHLLVLFPLL